MVGWIIFIEQLISNSRNGGVLNMTSIFISLIATVDGWMGFFSHRDDVMHLNYGVRTKKPRKNTAQADWASRFTMDRWMMGMDGDRHAVV